MANPKIETAQHASGEFATTHWSVVLLAGGRESQQADIVNPFFVVDNEPVQNISDFRFVSPQINFDAPTPWLFGDTGGRGTSVADGYYVMLRPLDKGEHTIHFGGALHFNAGELGPDPVDLPLDITYHITVANGRHGDDDRDDGRGGRRQ